MATVLEITVRPTTGALEEAQKFYSADQWDQKSEMELVRHVQELLNTVRPFGTRLLLRFEVEVKDVSTTRFLLARNSGKQEQAPGHGLTAREAEVFGLIMQGLTNNDIAEKLFISYETVKSHRKNILLKARAKNTAALVNSYHQELSTK